LVQQQGAVYGNIQRKETQEVLCFFGLDLGCLHARGKWYLATGILDVNIFENVSCDNSCCIFTKKWHDQFIPVYCFSVVALLEFLMQTGKLPVEVDYKDPISSLLAGRAFWKETACDQAGGEYQECRWMHCFYHSQHLLFGGACEEMQEDEIMCEGASRVD
jgi:hypothetical protein